MIDAFKPLASGYSKRTGSSSPINAQMVYEAIRRAIALDAATEEIPSKPLTRVYQMLNVLIEREAIVLKPSPGKL